MPRPWSVLARVEVIWVCKGGKKDKSWKQTKPEKAADKPDGIKDSSFSWNTKVVKSLKRKRR